MRNEIPSAKTESPASPITIVGAGLAGTLMAIFLARRNIPVLLLERRPDPRRVSERGRSINLALASRGIAALQAAGAFAATEGLLLPMPGRMLHDTQGHMRFVPYGQNATESIYSVGRNALTGALLDTLMPLPQVVVGFEQECLGADFERHALRMRDIPSGRQYRIPLERVIAADGAGSVLRRALLEAAGLTAVEEPLAHGYKELTLPADAAGNYQLDPAALHIWPRGGFMLIALPNTDGTFTLTLFLPFTGDESFATLHDAAAVVAFFERHFPDIAELLPDLACEFKAHPVGRMSTVHCPQWTDGERLVLLGDAAHAIVPFHGQGMNCAFEDCSVFDRLLQRLPWSEACQAFERQRQPDTEAIAAMAKENYIEMRDTVREEEFQLQKALSLELERRHPLHFIPRYSMVMFHHEIPYRVAQERGRAQEDILRELTRSATTLADIDFAAAQRLIEERLTPLSMVPPR